MVKVVRPSLDAGRETAWLGLLLTGAAGFVDAAGYLMLLHIYSANMSGNSVALGIGLYNQSWWEIWSRACPVLAFVPGLVLGAVIVEVSRRRQYRSCLAPAFVVQVVCLIAFVFLDRYFLGPKGILTAPAEPWFALLVGLLALVMGLQNGALRRVGALRSVHTYVTGTLLSFAQGVAELLFWLHDHLRSGNHTRGYHLLASAFRHASFRDAAFALGLWCTYILGAFGGAWREHHQGGTSMLWPVLLFLILTLVDLIHPVRCLRPGSSSAG